MRAVRCASFVALALAGAGCGGSDRPDPRDVRARDGTAAARAADARRPLCTRLRARTTGRVSAPVASELSGLVLSRSQRGVLWTHNDSGDSARLLAVSPRGRLLANLRVPGAEHVDWEAVATGPAAGPRDAIYIGDIGDNAAERSTVVVYRVAEPGLARGAPGATASARRLTLRYPDGAHDAEALLVDPSTGALVVVTKDFGGAAGVYVAARPSPAAVTTMRRAGTVRLGGGQAVTAGDASANGRVIVLRSYDAAFAWTRRRGQTIASAMRRRRCRARAGLLAEGQGEALALTRDGRAFFTVPEGRRPALRRYAPAR